MKFFRELWGKKDDGTELPETAMTLLRTQAETWTSLDPIENTLPASWETIAVSSASMVGTAPSFSKAECYRA